MREWDLLHYIFESNASLGDRVTIPPGDDMGAIQFGNSQLLVTVDQVADGVHVDLATTPIAKVARKAITRNLSDVAAMAAKPVAAVCAASLPKTMDGGTARRLFDAMRDTALYYDCPLIGGDISAWDGKLLLTVTVFAKPAGIEPVLRSGAKPGDAIYVTGTLGGSLVTINGYTHHLDFEPRLEIARKLAVDPRTRPHAMIDISDGVASDLQHICEMSGRGTIGGLSAVIDAAAVPLSEAVRNADDAVLRALTDGEDYELLIAAPPGTLPSVIDGVRITEIGRFEDAEGHPGVFLHDADGESEIQGGGWEHGR